MSDTASIRAFIDKWAKVTINERGGAQTHFNELCHDVIGVPAPLDKAHYVDFYRFEKPLTKTGGEAGFADVWYKDRFAWEYKTKGKYKDLTAAYQQLLLYKENLDNPPVLVACDIENYEVHIAFTGYRSRVEKFTNADLENASTRELLRLVFTDPEQLRPVERAETVTEIAAERLAKVAQFLERRKVPPAEIAHFFMKVLFGLFAEDIKILPAELLSKSIKRGVFEPKEFTGRVQALFRTMREGGYFGMDRIPRFNGWLFNDDEVLELTVDEIQFLENAARLDWSQVEPAIFGTLFERSLDPNKRAQLGAHYTSRDDILLIVEPVLMAPLRREWDAVKAQVEALLPAWEAATGAAKQRLKGQMEGYLFEFSERLTSVRVLDPACGSGNFLYVALNQLKDLEKEVWTFAGGLGLQQPTLGVSPAQLYGIEKNPFAAELAQVVVWIGYLQWRRLNGFFNVEEPVLQNLHNIQCRDAILTVDLNGQPAEPEWPEADVIIGNPPFLGGNRVRKELGDTYVDSLFVLYQGRVPAFADLVCYWFEKSRTYIAAGKAQRAGLLATNSIRGGVNRKVLERVKHSGDIFMAWGDRPWILDGAAVRVSMIGFDRGDEQHKTLNGLPVLTVNSDLSGATDLTQTKGLKENFKICFIGTKKAGSFDIAPSFAEELKSKTNKSGQQNTEVVLPWLNGQMITRRAPARWVIYFGEMDEQTAAMYEKPFSYVREYIYPERQRNNEERARVKWWQHRRPATEMYDAIRSLTRYIATPRISKHRVFVWVSSTTLPDDGIYIFARGDDYFFGVLHSRPHELWALRLGTSLEDRPRYTPTTTFETFPFPWPPGKEPQGDPLVEAIAEAARELVRLRDEWLNPTTDALDGVKLKERTLTNLYNKRPDWLTEAHRKLDEAVFAAYGWPADLIDDEILARLLALNLERAAGQGEAVVTE